jgi:hypothetical protein
MNKWTFALWFLCGFINGLTCFFCQAYVDASAKENDAYGVAFVLGIFAGVTTLVLGILTLFT